MHTRTLGRSGLEISIVGLGCNNFGGRCDAEQARAVVHAAIDAGITFFDTADVYGQRGRSEEFLGQALQGRRHDIVLATKFAGRMGDEPMHSGASRAWIVRAVEDSLRRLGTDFIDLYQAHQFDPRTPLEETLRALDDLMSAGKIRYIGNSNYAAWQLTNAHWVADTQRTVRFISAQNQYSLLNRGIEAELVPACNEFGLGVIPYSPLAGGLLTGKYRRGESPPEGARLADERSGRRWLTDGNFETVERLEAFAREAGHSLLDLAIGWLATQPHVGSVIAGATKPDQVGANVAAGAWVLSADELARVDEIAPPPD
jgi:aryl-alcohol dehydrogenase-like predicted oxidoreductase